MNNYSPLIAVLAGENLTKPNIKRELLTKNYVLNHSQKRDLKSGVELSHITFATVALLQTNNSKALGGNTELPLIGGNSDFLTELNKISYLPSKSEDSSQLEKINQLPVFDSFNYVDTVAVTGNNVKQEPRKLPVSVSHHTLVDVFLCLSFANCLFTGELRLALVRLWWGGHGNKPFIGRIPCAVLQRFSSLPTALSLGLIIKTSLPLEKVL